MSWDCPSWKEAAQQYHEARGNKKLIVETPPERLRLLRGLLRGDVSLERAWSELNDPRTRPTPQVVIEAIWQTVRERGPQAMKEPVNQERLAGCDEAAHAELKRRLASIHR